MIKLGLERGWQSQLCFFYKTVKRIWPTKYRNCNQQSKLQNTIKRKEYFKIEFLKKLLL